MKSLVIILSVLLIASIASAQTTRPASKQPTSINDVILSMHQEIGELRAEVARLKLENEQLKSRLAAAPSPAQAPASRSVAIATTRPAVAPATRPARTFNRPDEVIALIPQNLMSVKPTALQVDPRKQILFAKALGQNLRVVIPISAAGVTNNCIDNDGTRNTAYVSIKGTMEDEQSRCEVDAWFAKDMQTELARLNRGDIISIEGTIRSITILGSASRPMLSVRLKDCAYRRGAGGVVKNLDL